MNLQNIIEEIVSNPKAHSKSDSFYKACNKLLIEKVTKSYKDSAPVTKLTEGIEFTVPFHSMGNINTTHLFGLDEVMILAYYSVNADLYKNVLDLGANIGVHSIALSKLGYQVTCFEADPDTFKVLKSNLQLNQCDNVNPVNSAAGGFNGTAEFTRVCGNLTGSHLSGAKDNPYGKLEKFNVEVLNIGEIAAEYDLIKIDIEGQEADVLSSISPTVAKNIDFMMEINGLTNAKVIYEHARRSNLNIFIQNNNWQIAKSFNDLPLSHKEGSVFLSNKKQMPWPKS